MNKKADIQKAGGVLIKDRRFLVTRSKGKEIFVAPGGKLEGKETAIEALIREMMEEVKLDILEADTEPLGTYTAQAAGNETKTLKMDVFLIHRANGDPVPSSEVEEIMWVNTQTTGIQLGTIFEHQVMPKLVELNLID